MQNLRRRLEDFPFCGFQSVVIPRKASVPIVSMPPFCTSKRGKWKLLVWWRRKPCIVNDSLGQSQTGKIIVQILKNRLKLWFLSSALLQLKIALLNCQAQVLTKFATDIWLATVDAYKRGDSGGVAHYGDALLRLIRDMDDLLATVP